MDTKKIGAFIAENRKKKGLTQEQLGERLGVSNKTISRWENGNYMPDLSLLEPLSRELGISLNELIAGEEIPKENAIEYSEQNLISTIDYSDRKIKDVHKKISIFILGIGIFICMCAFTIFPSESSWGSIYSFAGLLLVIAGVFRLLKFPLLKKVVISILLFILISAGFFVADYVGVKEFKQPPIYRYTTTTIFNDDSRLIEYRTLFCNVYRINADTPNEYYLIDREKQYDIFTVPTSPFNQEKSAIENLMKYRSKYVGDNSNTGNLIGSLPFSEHGYVFEIDSENCGLTINYHFTDWYDGNLYTEKALVYNSVSMFSLIENLESITFNFSGSSFSIARDAIEENYPGYSGINKECKINIKKFHQYVDSKINDNEFVMDIMKLFEHN